MTKRIEILIVKYFSDTLSNTETKELISWIETDNNIDDFNKFIDINFTIEAAKPQSDNSKMWNYIEKRINTPKKKFNYWKYAAAATIAILLALPFLLKEKPVETNPEDSIIVNNTIERGTDKATLTLEDGNKILLTKGQSYIGDNVTSNGATIVYNKTNTNTKKTVYNYLTIPRGGQYSVTLSDGTQVWLNSESQLKYPKEFIDGDTRKVELIYGEAYFDVSPSSKHQGSKFNVVTGNQEIEVLGTEFNIKAYKDETFTYSTLVEGKVKITNGTFNTILSPNQQAVIKNDEFGIEVVDIDAISATSWRKGIFSFENMPLKDIMKVLARWYDFDVIFVDAGLKETEFTGILRKHQDIEDILQIIETVNNIKYEINNQTIILR